MGLLTRSPRTATVAALDEVTVMVITPEALDNELSQNGWLRCPKVAQSWSVSTSRRR